MRPHENKIGPVTTGPILLYVTYFYYINLLAYAVIINAQRPIDISQDLFLQSYLINISV